MASNERPLSIVYNAYAKLNHQELVLFLKVRNLPTSGADPELASRLAQHDFHTYHFPTASVESLSSSDSVEDIKPDSKSPQLCTPDLPIEILADILDHVGDWPLCRALGVPTSLPVPHEWSTACATDLAMLTGSVPLIRASDPALNPPTRLGAAAAVRFGYVTALEFLLMQHRPIFLSVFGDDLIPITASEHGRTAVLAWWKHGIEQHPELVLPPKPGTIVQAIDVASRNGKIASLDWWATTSGLPLEYTEASLEQASSKNHIAVLDWWKRQHELNNLPLKIGRSVDMASAAGHVGVLEWWATSQLEYQYDRHVMQHASCFGKVDVLEWWLGSGLQISFDGEALIGATRYNRSEALEWWNKSGLPIQYRMCDIEEALEDAIGGGDKARRWWKKKGVNFKANDREWMKLQSLN